MFCVFILVISCMIVLGSRNRFLCIGSMQLQVVILVVVLKLLVGALRVWLISISSWKWCPCECFSVCMFAMGSLLDSVHLMWTTWQWVAKVVNLMGQCRELSIMTILQRVHLVESRPLIRLRVRMLSYNIDTLTLLGALSVMVREFVSSSCPPRFCMIS